jgi:hypothetical protein
MRSNNANSVPARELIPFSGSIVSQLLDGVNGFVTAEIPAAEGSSGFENLKDSTSRDVTVALTLIGYTSNLRPESSRWTFRENSNSERNDAND